MTPPPRLRPGDPVAVIAPSSPFDRAAFEKGLERLAARYAPSFRSDLFACDRYLAGSDARRLAELQDALAGAAAAVFCARGGYGALRLLPRLALPARPKLLVGFSDITALHAALQRQGQISIHGPVVTQLGRLAREQVDALFDLLELPSTRPLLRGRPVVPGAAEGPVVGGNLSVFTRLLGTPFLPDLEGAILFLEDVGERPYRLDRMWQHLALAGVFDRVAGIALGELIDCDDRDPALTGERVLCELAEKTGLPCVAALPCGHGDRNEPFPLGARARLDASQGTLLFLEGAVR